MSVSTYVFRVDGELVWAKGKTQTDALKQIADASDDPIRSVEFVEENSNLRWDYSGDGLSVTTKDDEQEQPVGSPGADESGLIV